MATPNLQIQLFTSNIGIMLKLPVAVANFHGEIPYSPQQYDQNRYNCPAFRLRIRLAPSWLQRCPVVDSDCARATNWLVL